MYLKLFLGVLLFVSVISCKKKALEETSDTSDNLNVGPVDVVVPCTHPKNWIQGAQFTENVSVYVDNPNTLDYYELRGSGVNIDYSIQFLQEPAEGYYTTIGNNSIYDESDCFLRVHLGWTSFYSNSDTVYVENEGDSLRITWCDLTLSYGSSNVQSNGYIVSAL